MISKLHNYVFVSNHIAFDALKKEIKFPAYQTGCQFEPSAETVRKTFCSTVTLPKMDLPYDRFMGAIGKL